MCSIYGKIIGDKNPVFVEFNSDSDITSVCPLVATFDHGKHSYILLETGNPRITGFRFDYTDAGIIHLDANLCDEELKIVKLALGIIVTSLIYQEEYCAFENISYETFSKLKRFSSVVFEVMKCNAKDFDIIEEISRRSGSNLNEVVQILLELSNIPLDTNPNRVSH